MIKEDYYKICKVIESCYTIDHLRVTDKLIDNFIRKWKSHIEIDLYAAKLGSVYRLKYKNYGEGVQK